MSAFGLGGLAGTTDEHFAKTEKLLAQLAYEVETFNRVKTADKMGLAIGAVTLYGRTRESIDWMQRSSRAHQMFDTAEREISPVMRYLTNLARSAR